MAATRFPVSVSLMMSISLPISSPWLRIVWLKGATATPVKLFNPIVNKVGVEKESTVTPAFDTDEAAGRKV
jgi:hypothetical protein